MGPAVFGASNTHMHDTLLQTLLVLCHFPMRRDSSPCMLENIQTEMAGEEKTGVTSVHVASATLLEILRFIL
ncbi:hypothetical protein FRX31_030133 [Thalictrum thalictroides]|uniref:Uncharacterized protein n=1 Tax=Thalictrum thalictroides TaxID=46969 RepID=A0A7J6V6I1_THATH|nr:hypothetical protein FRX31_030133 [Thalictrum thalictroides]